MRALRKRVQRLPRSLIGEARLHYRTGVGVVAVLLLGVVITLPFTLASIWDEMTSPPEGEVFHIGPAADLEPAGPHARLHLALVVFDDLTRLATVRITGQYICPAPCPVQDRLWLFSLSEDEEVTEGLAFSTVVPMPTSTQPVSTTVQLPLRGSPVRYPFDQFELWLGVVPERELAAGSVARHTKEDATGIWYLTFQEKLPRLTLVGSQEVFPALMETVDNDRMDLHYAFVHRFTFERPAYLRVLALTLVLLVTAAAGFAVFLRPLQELVLSAGGLVLGIWGVSSEKEVGRPPK